jgi:homoserine dehydrogenase
MLRTYIVYISEYEWSMMLLFKIWFSKERYLRISQISGEDVAFATELGYSIKHLGIAKKLNGKIQMRVHPTLMR